MLEIILTYYRYLNLFLVNFYFEGACCLVSRIICCCYSYYSRLSSWKLCLRSLVIRDFYRAWQVVVSRWCLEIHKRILLLYVLRAIYRGRECIRPNFHIKSARKIKITTMSCLNTDSGGLAIGKEGFWRWCRDNCIFRRYAYRVFYNRIVRGYFTWAWQERSVEIKNSFLTK